MSPAALGGRGLPPVVLAALIALTGCLSGCAASGRESPGAAAPTASPTASPAPAPVERVLQLNLCGSGIASCYTGRATREAADVVRRERPDSVTLNEVCDSDVTAVERALAEGSAGPVSSAFRPARDGRTGEPYRCRDGRRYGIGVVARGEAAGPPASGIHPAQDPADPEQRAWLCLETIGAAPRTVCTTHLAYTDRDVTVRQCRHLFDVVVPGRRTPVIVGADLNLGPAGSADLEACLPPGTARANDGGPQHVVGPPDRVVVASELVDLRDTTDRPGLLATLAPASAGTPTMGGSPP